MLFKRHSSKLVADHIMFMELCIFPLTDAL